MKIVLVHGQNHKGSTWNTANKLIENITCEKEIIEFFLPKDLNHFCVGCYQCLESRDKCPFWDEKKIIDDAIKDCDLLVLTSPNYCMMPSAPMKAFLDLFYTNWISHKPYGEMFSKRAVVISTTAGAGAKKVTKLLANNLHYWGIPEVIQFGLPVQATNWKMVPQKIKDKISIKTKKLGSRLSKNKKVHIGIRTRFLFWMGSGMQKANWGASKFEKAYWESKGWLNGTKPWRDKNENK